MTVIPDFKIGIWNAWIFMIWLILHTIATRLLSKELYRKAGDPYDMRPSLTYRIMSYVSMLVWLVGSIYSIFLPLQLGTLWFYIGLPIFLIGLVMLTIASINFATTPIDEPVVKGVYRCSRHPMYMAMFFIYFSVGIASASWVFLSISAVGVFSMCLGAIEEERYCLEEYGISYSEYMSRTPRWMGIPK